METHPMLINRSLVVAAIAKLRAEWAEAAGEESLVDIESSVGLLLVDLVSALDLSSDEQLLALGPNLVNELEDVLITVPEGNGRH